MIYNDYLMHFNPNHDPNNGRFTTKDGGVVSKSSTFRSPFSENIVGEKNKIKKHFNKVNARSILIGAGIGTAVAVSFIAAHAGIKLYKSGMLDAYISSGKRFVSKVISTGTDANNSENHKRIFDSLKGIIPSIGRKESLYDTLKKTNPHYHSESYRNNCSSCSLATFLRTVGLDAYATRVDGAGKKPTFIEECFKIDKNNGIFAGYATKFSKSADAAAKMLKLKFGDNASGIVGVDFNNGDSGHIFNWSISDGKVEFFDGQDPTGIREDWFCRRYIWDKIKKDGVFFAYRLDNAEPIIDGILKYIE